MDRDQNNRTTYEERQGRSSLQVSRWVLHDLPSISGCHSKCCQPSNEAYHGGCLAIAKTGTIAAEILKSRPLLPVRKGMEREEDFAGAGGLPKAI
jgi:hypothetical protein